MEGKGGGVPHCTPEQSDLVAGNACKSIDLNEGIDGENEVIDYGRWLA